MNLITEYNEDSVEVITEAKEDGKKNYFIEGIFMQGDIKNRNGRIYPSATLENEMSRYQKEFIEFALEKQVLKFGEFTLKSGRKSPYFFNAGLFNTGGDLAKLGRFYASALVNASLA